MLINEKGLEIIKRYESLQLKAYLCPGDTWTIGYGHTKGVKEGQAITEKQALEYLRQDIEEVEKHLKYLTQSKLLSLNQFSAIVSLVFNIGIGAFERSTLRVLIPYSKEKAADEFLKWKFSKGKLLFGLYRRRQEERALYLLD